MTPDRRSWDESSLFIKAELERLNRCYESINSKLDCMIREVEGLKVKSGFWGAIGGMLPFLIAVLIWIIKTQ